MEEKSNLPLNTFLELPSNVGFGEISRPSPTNITFEATTQPMAFNEISLSSALYRHIFKDQKVKKVTITYLSQMERAEEQVKRTYVSKELTIKEVIASTKYYLSQTAFWLQHLFPHYFALSASEQIISSIALHGQNMNVTALINDNAHYDIENPLATMREDIKPMKDILTITFSVISGVIIFISIILILIVMDLFYAEEENDRHILFILGGTQADIMKYHLVNNIFSLTFSYLSAVFSLYGVLFINTLETHSPIAFEFSLKPFWLMSIVVVTISFIITIRVFLQRNIIKKQVN